MAGISAATRWLSVVLLLLLGLTNVVRGDYTTSQTAMYAAIVNVTYRDPTNGELKSYVTENGRYGMNSRLDSEWGKVVHTRGIDNKTDGCKELVNVPKTRWIALIERCNCNFQVKIHNAAIKNASAVVVYDHVEENGLIAMDHKVMGVVAVFITRSEGRVIAELVDKGLNVTMHISVGHPDSINKTSVLFVTVSFIDLMIISLAWLVFY